MSQVDLLSVAGNTFNRKSGGERRTPKELRRRDLAGMGSSVLDPYVFSESQRR